MKAKLKFEVTMDIDLPKGRELINPEWAIAYALKNGIHFRSVDKNSKILYIYPWNIKAVVSSWDKLLNNLEDFGKGIGGGK